MHTLREIDNVLRTLLNSRLLRLITAHNEKRGWVAVFITSSASLLAPPRNSLEPKSIDVTENIRFSKKAIFKQLFRRIRKISECIPCDDYYFFQFNSGITAKVCVYFGGFSLWVGSVSKENMRVFSLYVNVSEIKEKEQRSKVHYSLL